MKSKIFNNVKPFLTKHSPEILIGMGVSGMIFSTVYAVKGTIKAVKAVELKKKELNVEKLKFKDLIKCAWKYYIPSAIGELISIPCIVAGTSISNKRNAALAAAYTLSETALQSFQDKTTELIGEKKVKDIQESIADDNVKKNYIPETTNVIMTGDGDSLFYEPLSGRYFKSNWNKILKAANELNAECINDISGVITLSQWFWALGLDETDISDQMGWDVLKNGTKGLIGIHISSNLTKDDKPCGSIYYDTRPTWLK